MNKVIGNFHLSPGRSFQANAMHVHDLVPYLQDGNKHDFGHIINRYVAPSLARSCLLVFETGLMVVLGFGYADSVSAVKWRRSGEFVMAREGKAWRGRSGRWGLRIP